MAVMNDHTAAAVLLLERGAQGAGGVLGQGAESGNKPLVDAALEVERPDARRRAGGARGARGAPARRSPPRSRKRLAEHPGRPRRSLSTVPCCRRTSATIATTRPTFTVALNGDQLVLTPPGAPQPLTLIATSPTAVHRSRGAGRHASRFAGRGGTIERLVVTTPERCGAEFPRVGGGGGRCASRSGPGPGRAPRTPPARRR